MASPRLSSLYPQIFKAIRSCEPTTYRTIRACSKKPSNRRAGLHTTARRSQETYQQRYGPAASTSLPPPPKPAESLTPKQEAQPKSRKTAKDAKKNGEATKQQAPASAPADSKTAAPEEQPKKADQDSDFDLEKPEDGPLQNKELDMVLSIPSPSEVKGEAHKHPHLEASPYEHHFDTYSLVRQLANGGFTQDQSVTVMKAVRLMLANNLDIAKEGLVSKSDVENETYLFRAACSELRTTLQSSRQSETQRQRSSRAQLQHEVDILSQKTTQDLASMREDLKGMFNDRKLSLGEEKRKIDGKIQELNYEITVLLNSDSKSEVEGLRWVLTRRAALAIVAAAFMILASLNYSSTKIREQQEAEKKRKAAEAITKQRADARYTTPSRTQGTQTDSGTQAGNYEESLG